MSCNTNIVETPESKSFSGKLTTLVTDRVIVALIAAFSALALFDLTQASSSLRFTFDAIVAIAPFLLLAVALAAAIKASGADQLVAKVFSGHPVRSIVLAALAGALSPFCSCGVVPLIAAMLRARVPLAPVMAFWIASPIMDPEMFVLTAAGIDLQFALVKTIATFFMGALAGFTIYLLPQTGSLRDPLMVADGKFCATHQTDKTPIQWAFWRQSERRQVFGAEFRVVALFLTKWLLLAFLLESLMVAYVPSAWVAAALGSGAWYEIPLAAVVGIPAYLNGYAAIPLINGLLDLGMNRGAALAFMTAGAVSSIPAAMAVFALVKRSVFITYLGLGLLGSILSGVIYAAFTI